ncbi:amidohydrolase [Nocardioides sp. AN3]
MGVGLGVDLVLHSGTVMTLDRRSRVAEAVAVRDGRIVATGSSRDMLELAGPDTRRVDLAGGSVLPGINDSHLHLAWWAESRDRIDLSGVTTLAEVQDAVRRHVAGLPPDAWVLGQGWHEGRLQGVGPAGPTADDLNGLAGGRPVFLQHFSAHGGWLDREGLRRAGITAGRPDPEGGTFVRDEAGEPTGIVQESALAVVRRAVGEPSAAQRHALIEEALRELVRRGVTSVTDPLVSAELMRDYVALRNADRLAARVTTLLNWGSYVTTSVPVLEDALRYVGSVTGLGDDLLRVGGCKLMADGVAALGTSWMERATADGHRCGSLVTEGDDDAERLANLRRLIALLHEHRFQVQVHATGDLACDAVVEAFGELMTRDPWDARHVLIHANHPSAESMRTMARHGLVANVNALVKRQAAAGLVSILEPAAWHSMMPARSLLEAGVVLADASDAPVTEPRWQDALQMLVTRVPLGFDSPSGPDERLTREEALRAWTVAPAYQDHAEDRKGTIEPGKLADLTVIAEDFLTVPDEELHGLTNVMTVLGGEVVFEA